MFDIHENINNVDEFIIDQLKEIKEETDKESTIYSTGLEDLDKVIGGIKESELIAIASFESKELDIFIHNLLCNLSKQSPVGCITCNHELKNSHLRRNESVSTFPIYYESSVNHNIMELKSKIYDLVMKKNVKIVFLTECRVLNDIEIGTHYITHGTFIAHIFMKIALELNISIVLSFNCEFYESYRSRDINNPVVPYLFDYDIIRSNNFKQLISLYVPYKYNSDQSSEESTSKDSVLLNIMESPYKNRRCGMNSKYVKLSFNEKSAEFSNYVMPFEKPPERLIPNSKLDSPDTIL